MKVFVTILAITVLFISTASAIDDNIGRYVDDIFYRYDTNEDRYLDRTEARTFFRDATESPKIDDGEYSEWFRLIDANKDGKLSWDELYRLAESAA